MHGNWFAGIAGSARTCPAAATTTALALPSPGSGSTVHASVQNSSPSWVYLGAEAE